MTPPLLSDQEIQESLTWANKFTTEMMQASANSSKVLTASIAFQLAALSVTYDLALVNGETKETVEHLHKQLTKEITLYATQHGFTIIDL